MAIKTASIGKKFAKVAMGKVQQTIPTTDANVTSVSNRVSVLEGYNLDQRLDVLEAQTLNTRLTTAEGKITTLQSQVATLMSQMTTMLSHKHNYDDSGTQKQTSTPV